jgi:OmpA-OmpF porin, OOP family
MKRLSYFIISITLLFFSSVLFAQDEDKRWAVSVHGGTAVMQGDGDVGNLNIAGGLGLKYSLASNFSIRVALMGGSMESKNLGEVGSIYYPYKTTTSFYEGNIQALLNIVNFKSQNTGKNVAQLYVGIGAGYTNANIKYTPSMPPTEAASVSSVIVPFSAGIRFYISPLIDLGFEYSIKGTFTDHLDGFLPSGFSNKSNDYYNTPQAYVTFNLGSSKSARNIEWIEQTEKLYEELIKAKKEAQQQIDKLRIQNEKLMVNMKKDLNTQLIDNQRKADSTMKMMQASMKNDSDSDGVSNIFDKEPNSPPHAIVDGSGRMLDVDKDGVPDYLDKCPTVYGKASNSGCPVQPTKTQLTTISDGIKNLQFETGKAIIKSTSFPALNALAKMLVENSTFSFKIEGHTDNVGNSTDNLNLSIQRAESVRLYLVSKGVDGARITAKGFGDTKPIVSNDTAAGKAKNRRVDMIIE